MMWWKWEREKRNSGNSIAKICAQKNLADLPKIGDWLDRNLKKKKKKNCGNWIAIVARVMLPPQTIL